MNPQNAVFLQFQNDNEKKVFLRLNALSDGDGEDEEMQSDVGKIFLSGDAGHFFINSLISQMHRLSGQWGS